MFLGKCLLTFSLILLNKSTAQNLKDGGIVPDIVDSVLNQTLSLDYNGTKVEMGNELTPTKVKDIPNVSWTAESGSLYTLMMVDPDAPSRQNPKFREYLHWIVVNVPDHDLSRGETLVEYIGAGPPEGTNLHRYVFLLFKQPGSIQPPAESRISNRSSAGRPKFKTRQFAQKYHLGEPIAGNYFQAKWDNYVPKLYEQLSGK